MSQQHTEAREHNSGAVETGHPSPLTYFKVAITLSALTAAEFGIFYWEGIGYWIIPILGLMSAAKFILVAMYYMHLKFEASVPMGGGRRVPIFSVMFVAGLIVAAGVVFALMALFEFFA